MSPTPSEINFGQTDPRSSLNQADMDDVQTTGYPVVAKQFARRDRAGLMLGASIALLLGSATLFAMASNRGKVMQPVPAPMQPAASVQYTAPAVEPVALAPAAIAVAPVAMPPQAMTPLSPPLDGQAAAMAARAQAPALILDNGYAGAAAAPAAVVSTAAMASGGSAPAASAPLPKPATDSLSADEQFAQRIGGGNADTATAQRMISPSATVAQGTLMTAVLETAVNSDLPGYVRAVISQDVRSYDRSRVLIPRGSHLIGEYKSGLSVGQTRAYILWTRLLRPDGVSVALASPATDFAGRNGLGGKVDSHFLKRFGSAILLSVIAAGGQAIGGGNGTVVLAGPQAAIGATAQRDVSIPPTVNVKLGQPIRIFTARDLDFSAVSDTP